MEIEENKSLAATDVIFPGCDDLKGELWFKKGFQPADDPAVEFIQAEPGTFFILEGEKEEMVSGPALNLGLKPGCGGRLNPHTLTWTKDCKHESN